MPVSSTITNAPAPITGGKNIPPMLAEASTAPAVCGLKPTRFISGMVSVPVDTVLAIALPEILPMSADASTATLAGPPTARPAMPNAISIKNCPTPERFKKAPKKINRITKFTSTCDIVPQTPRSSKKTASLMRDKS